MQRSVSPETLIAIICLRLAGWSVLDICSRVGVSAPTVCKYSEGVLPRGARSRESRGVRSPELDARMLAAWSEPEADRSEVAARFGYRSAASLGSTLSRVRARLREDARSPQPPAPVTETVRGVLGSPCEVGSLTNGEFFVPERSNLRGRVLTPALGRFGPVRLLPRGAPECVEVMPTRGLRSTSAPAYPPHVVEEVVT